MQVQRQAQKDLQTGALNDETVNAYFQQHMQKVLESFWKINVTDIESTLKQVVAQVRAELDQQIFQCTRCHICFPRHCNLYMLHQGRQARRH